MKWAEGIIYQKVHLNPLAKWIEEMLLPMYVGPMRGLLVNDLLFVFVLFFLGFTCFCTILNGNNFFACAIQRIPIVYVILSMIHSVIVPYFSVDGSTVELR